MAEKVCFLLQHPLPPVPLHGTLLLYQVCASAPDFKMLPGD